MDRQAAERPILLVEDNAVNRMVAEGMLRLLGFAADVVENGVEAIEALRSTAYEVVLMDVQMPEMDGYEATGVIRDELPADEQPYIIALTANALMGDEQVCLDAGMDDYLSKPLAKDALAAALQRSSQRRAR